MNTKVGPKEIRCRQVSVLLLQTCFALKKYFYLVFFFFSGLRKVTDDMKTYKNPKLREGPPPYKVTNQGPKPYSKPSVTTPAKHASVKHAPVVVEKPPVFELQNKKWIIVSTGLY